MNYYSPQQRQSDKRWDYTCTNDGRTWPVGYCHKYRPYEEKDLWIFHDNRERMEEANKELERFASHYHADGHATADEACSCYRRYVLDHRSMLHRKANSDADELHRCAICGAWCANLGEVDNSYHWYLCDEHLTQQSLEDLFPDIGVCWSSC